VKEPQLASSQENLSQHRDRKGLLQRGVLYSTQVSTLFQLKARGKPVRRLRKFIAS